jgi:neopullulanase
MPIDTPAWVRDAVFYQIFPDRFAQSDRVPKPGPLQPWDDPPTHHGFKGGDLLGIEERLPYLVDLGVTALYLNPVFTSASNHRYHTDDYLSVDPMLGGDAALRSLLDSAHARGMRVVLDGVFNHTGRGFLAFHHVLENGIASPYIDWYHVDRARLAAGRPLVAYPELATDHGGHGGHDVMDRLGYAAWWGLPALPKLNTDHPPVRELLLSAAEHWLRFGIDGWRLDVPGEIDDPAFWTEFRRRCRAVRPDAYLVGELWHEAPEWLAGDRFDAAMNYPLAEAILGFAAGVHLDRGALAFHHEYREKVHHLDGEAFAAELDRLMGLYDAEVTAVQLNLIGSHDTPRFRTLAGGGVEALRLAFALQVALPGAPCIYYGDEIGMVGQHDPDNRRAFPTDESAWDHDLLAFVRAVVALRHAEPTLRHGSFRVAGASGGAVAIERRLGGRSVILVVEAGELPSPIEIRLPQLPSGRLTAVPLPGWEGTTEPSIALDIDGRAEIRLPPRSGAILRAGP